MEEINKKVEEIAQEINKNQSALKSAIESKADAETIKGLEASILEMNEKQVELKDILAKQGQTLNELNRKTIEAEDHTSAIFKGLQDAKDKILQMKASGKGHYQFNTKATVSSAEVAGTTIGSRVPGIGEIPFRRRFLEDIFASSTVGDGQGNVLQYTDQANVNRAAGNVAECTPYPALSDIDWQEFTCKIEKIGDTIKVCREAMDDFDFVESEIRNLLLTSVDQRMDQQLLLGTGTTPELKGIDSVASTFAAGSYATSIKAASLYDLIHVIGSQIMEVGENMFMANAALMNPVDATKLLSTKDQNDNYIIPPFASENGRLVNGIQIIESTLVPANTMYVMDSTKGVVYNRKSLTIDVSFENEDDFNKDLVTIKASRRAAFLIRNVWANAFTKVPDITAAITAITAP